ncbi:DUF4328 domain-containing protein [Streptomyces sp. H34-S4]|uniref:DUF4328 domain-containing protein n=1 Tax=Streptomyces sp. H34-S4 TaxID=2996463 RepID=UPI00226FC9EE|nr:DUF4328 domain-containing protein [Streptomyces sp. H34-S4]MCY0936533.1 DUF4328 domain-containing protein [Streptomyces sp. H34-S4]
MSFAAAKLPPLGAPPARSRLRSPKGLATALTVLLGLCAATRLLAVAAGVNRYLALDSFTEFMRAGSSSQLVYMSMSLVLMAMVPTAVVFIVWFHRVRVNADVYAAGTFRGGPGWAIGMWFVPAVGWTVLPCLTALKVWAASAARLSGTAALASAVPVVAWSGTFGAAMLASAGAGRLEGAAVGQSELRDAVLAAAASDLLFAVAAVLAVVFVRRLSAMQSAA